MKQNSTSSRVIYRRRVTLGLAAGIYVLIYLLVVGVAFITSGKELFRDPVTWYSFLAPVSYAVFCLLYATGAIRPALSLPAIILIHLVVLPALVSSFLLLGVVLPILGLLWWHLYRAVGGRPAEGRQP